MSNKLKYVFNPFTGNFEQVIEPLTKQQVIGSILLTTDETNGVASIIFDEDSILYADDNYIA